ncbi:hypothetical protein P3T76_012436 [Phytophthora citrophthora]|uniref:Kazal-like domain-containing protein n=1 Tax=Phytophthora citrophthora TaxID=4793 RepID=A0AAD9G4C6_9STRA|nr:hypothetical protein P3T76_012436 [Phytophthora citrophthora]
MCHQQQHFQEHCHYSLIRLSPSCPYSPRSFSLEPPLKVLAAPPFPTFDAAVGPQVCASNGVTYENKCYFNLANCDNKGMRVLHNGMSLDALKPEFTRYYRNMYRCDAVFYQLSMISCSEWFLEISFLGHGYIFLKTLNPPVQQCVRESCTAIETVELLFIMSSVRRDVAIALGFMERFFLSGIRLAATTIHDLKLEWSQRHKTPRSLAGSYCNCFSLDSFRRHCQFIYSHAENIGVDEAVVVEILRQLGFKPLTAEFAIVSVFASLLIAGTSAQIDCGAVPNIRCDQPAGPQVCGSNGVTYDNKCLFDLANCDNKGMRVLHNGMCRRDGTR